MPVDYTLVQYAHTNVWRYPKRPAELRVDRRVLMGT
jgi:hypothetical protein